MILIVIIIDSASLSLALLHINFHAPEVSNHQIHVVFVSSLTIWRNSQLQHFNFQN